MTSVVLELNCPHCNNRNGFRFQARISPAGVMWIPNIGSNWVSICDTCKGSIELSQGNIPEVVPNGVNKHTIDNIIQSMNYLETRTHDLENKNIALQDTVAGLSSRQSAISLKGML